MAGNKPDYRLKIFHKQSHKKNIAAGAAWKNPDGSITIHLAPGVVLTHDDDLHYRLWPAESSYNGQDNDGDSASDSDDIPF